MAQFRRLLLPPHALSKCHRSRSVPESRPQDAFRLERSKRMAAAGRRPVRREVRVPIWELVTGKPRRKTSPYSQGR